MRRNARSISREEVRFLTSLCGATDLAQVLFDLLRHDGTSVVFHPIPHPLRLRIAMKRRRASFRSTGKDSNQCDRTMTEPAMK